MRLRDYQTKATRRIDAEWKAGHRAVLLVMPPNAGKTVVFLHVIRKALKCGERVCVVAPNVVLTQQTIDKFSHIDHGIIWADKTTGEDKQLQIASAPTLANRLDEYEFDLIVVDEAHHCAANTWKKILDRYNTARVLGVTATAKRLDGKGLDACGFTGLVRGPWIDSLTPQYMTPFRMWAPNVPELLDAPEGSDYKAADLAKHGIEMGVLIGDAVKHYTKHCAGKRALAFCMSIEDSKATVNRFARAGYKAAHMDGNTPHEERRALLDALNARRLDLISSCNVLGEGLDIPGVDVVIQLRPTRSYQMWLQQLGRGFRLDAENPDKLLDVIDCAGNYFRFWSPSVDRGYGLDGAPSLDVERQQTQRRCAECGLVYMADGRGYCPECHAETAAAAAADTERRAVWRDGELVQVGGGELVLSEDKLCKCFYTTKTINGNGKKFNLGSDMSIAQDRVYAANARWKSNGYVWPESIQSMCEWLNIPEIGKRPLRIITSNRDGFKTFSVFRNKMHAYLGTDLKAANDCVNSANIRWKENGYVWPDTQEELREWLGLGPKTSENPLTVKVRRIQANGKTQYMASKENAGVNLRVSLGTHLGIAQIAIDNANAKWAANGNEWPNTLSEFRTWLGLNAVREIVKKPLKVTSAKQGSKMRFQVSKRIGKSTCFHLGTDPAIAQARVDQANARWEANGYKWPDTAEEFREWLTLPPP